jgi:hypothetical protein
MCVFSASVNVSLKCVGDTLWTVFKVFLSDQRSVGFEDEEEEVAL